MKRKFLLILSFILSLNIYSQSVLTSWKAINTATTTFPLSASYNQSIISSATTNYYGLTTSNDSRNFWTSSNSSSTLNINSAPYLSFVINFNGNQNVHLDRFCMYQAENGSANNTIKADLRWSVDNFQNTIGSFNIVRTPYYNHWWYFENRY
jgi:hypothetical protein